MTPAALQATLGHEDIITVDELPVLPWKSGGDFLSADFDFDGDVDNDDLAAWEAAYAQSRASDADFNGSSDGVDFLLLQRQFTESGSLEADSAAVSEPDSLVLTLATFVAIIARHRNHRLPK